MIHLILDTNIYRHNPDRSSLDFKALEKLAIADLLKLHLPYIVQREFQTQQREIYSKDLDKVQSGLSGLLRKKLSEPLAIQVTQLAENLNSIKELILIDVENQIIEWANGINAITHPLNIEQANAAMEAYFKGTAPLQTPKSREDIPDSFIARAAEEIALQYGDSHIIVADEKLHATFFNNENFTVHKTLSDFIESALVQDQLKDLDVLKNLEEIKAGIKLFEEESNEISSVLNGNIGESVYFKQISDQSIPDDNHVATIQSYNDPEEIDLDWETIFYYGNGTFGVNFQVKMTVTAFYYYFKADFYSIDANFKDLPYVTDHNDHYFEAEEDFDILVFGVVSIAINRDEIDFSEFSECIETGSIKISSIDSIKLA